MYTKAQGVRLFGAVGMMSVVLGITFLLYQGTLLGAFRGGHALLTFGLVFLFCSFAVQRELFGRQGRPFLAKAAENISEAEYATRPIRVSLYALGTCFFSLYGAVALAAYILGNIKSPMIPIGLWAVTGLFLYMWLNDIPNKSYVRKDAW